MLSQMYVSGEEPRNEQRDARAQTVTLLQQLVQDNDNDIRKEELANEKGINCSQLAKAAIQAATHAANEKERAEKYLSTLEQGTVLL